MNTSWKQICTCKSLHVKYVWNTKTSQYHITATPHYYRKTFYSYILVVHFTASTIWGLQKLGLVGMVSYHYIFQILKCFWRYPNLNEVLSVGPILIWAVVICSYIYNICKSDWRFSNLPKWFWLYQSLNETLSIAKIWSRLLEFAQMFLSVCNFKWSGVYYSNWNEAVWNYPKFNEGVPLGPKLNGAIVVWPELM